MRREVFLSFEEAKRFRLWGGKQVTEEGFDLKSKLETEQWI